MEFSIKDFFNKFDQICKELRIWSHLLMKSLTENPFSVQCNVCLSIKQQTPKLKTRINITVMENELKSRHRQKQNLKKDIKAFVYQLRLLLPTLLHTAVLHQINLAIRSRLKSIVKSYECKLIKFKRAISYTIPRSDTSHVKVNKHIIHNFSSYVLSPEDITALSFELDYHIPSKVDKNSINTEFEPVYENLLPDNFHLPEHTLSRIKIKLRYTCDKYCNIKRQYEYQKVIQNLRGNQSILILKQHKGRGVVIMNLNTCKGKCFSILSLTQFIQLNHDPTDKSEQKPQRVIKKLKLKFPSKKVLAKFMEQLKFTNCQQMIVYSIYLSDL